jgi:hypothetical protein
MKIKETASWSFCSSLVTLHLSLPLTSESPGGWKRLILPTGPHPGASWQRWGTQLGWAPNWRSQANRAPRFSRAARNGRYDITRGKGSSEPAPVGPGLNKSESSG